MAINFHLRLNRHIQKEELLFTTEAKQRLDSGLKEENLIVARATPSSNYYTRWVIIYLNRSNGISDSYFKMRYTIQDFELPVEENAASLTLQDRLNKKTWYVRKEEEIYDILKMISISPQKFTTPEVCNYPF